MGVAPAAIQLFRVTRSSKLFFMWLQAYCSRHRKRVGAVETPCHVDKSDRFTCPNNTDIRQQLKISSCSKSALGTRMQGNSWHGCVLARRSPVPSSVLGVFGLDEDAYSGDWNLKNKFLSPTLAVLAPRLSPALTVCTPVLTPALTLLAFAAMLA